jgi:hypothetical protein
MLPEKFNGSSPLLTFFAHFDNCSQFNGWTDEDRSVYLRWCLTGDAALLLWEKGQPTSMTYGQLKEAIRRRYGTAGQELKYQTELRYRRRGMNETLQALHQDVRLLFSLAYPGETSAMSEQLACDAFLRALGDRQLEFEVSKREPADLETALRITLQLETFERVRDQTPPREEERPRMTRQVRVRNEDDDLRRFQNMEAELSRLRRRQPLLERCERQGRHGAMADRLQQPAALPAVRRTVTGRGPDGGRRFQRRPVTATGRAAVKCCTCGGMGHYARECRRCRVQEGLGPWLTESGTHHAVAHSVYREDVSSMYGRQRRFMGQQRKQPSGLEEAKRALGGRSGGVRGRL